VGAPKDPVGNGYGSDPVCFQEGQNLLLYGLVAPNVLLLDEPPLERGWVLSFVVDDANGDFRGPLVGWSIEGYGATG